MNVFAYMIMLIFLSFITIHRGSCFPSHFRWSSGGTRDKWIIWGIQELGPRAGVESSSRSREAGARWQEDVALDLSLTLSESQWPW